MSYTSVGAGLGEQLAAVRQSVGVRKTEALEQAAIAVGIKSGKLTEAQAARKLTAISTKWNIAGFGIPKWVLLVSAAGGLFVLLKARKGKRK